MSAIDDLRALGEFPAVEEYARQCSNHRESRLLKHGPPTNFERGVYQGFDFVQTKADAVIEELADKLVASIEWGRIEQKRKQKAEAKAARLERVIDAGREEYELAVAEMNRRGEEVARLNKVVDDESLRLQRIIREKDEEVARLEGKVAWLMEHELRYDFATSDQNALPTPYIAKRSAGNMADLAARYEAEHDA